MSPEGRHHRPANWLKAASPAGGEDEAPRGELQQFEAVCAKFLEGAHYKKPVILKMLESRPELRREVEDAIRTWTEPRARWPEALKYIDPRLIRGLKLREIAADIPPRLRENAGVNRLGGLLGMWWEWFVQDACNRGFDPLVIRALAAGGESRNEPEPDMIRTPGNLRLLLTLVRCDRRIPESIAGTIIRGLESDDRGLRDLYGDVIKLYSQPANPTIDQYLVHSMERAVRTGNLELAPPHLSDQNLILHLMSPLGERGDTPYRMLGAFERLLISRDDPKLPPAVEMRARELANHGSEGWPTGLVTHVDRLMRTDPIDVLKRGDWTMALAASIIRDGGAPDSWSDSISSRSHDLFRNVPFMSAASAERFLTLHRNPDPEEDP